MKKNRYQEARFFLTTRWWEYKKLLSMSNVLFPFGEAFQKLRFFFGISRRKSFQKR